MPSLTARLVRQIRGKPVNDGDIEQAANFLLDAIANIIAGTNSGPGRKILAWARALSRVGGLAGLDQPRQAFVLGALCHILEVDDLHRASVVHPGCVVVPALVALGGGRDGRQVLTGLLHGFEATTRIGMSVGPAHYRIWHNTATCGPFGSAMASAHLLGLDDGQAMHALGNAGSQAAGLWEFLATGAETKHLHAGRGAEAGVVAAGLAAHGFTGAPRILEGERGFFRAACPDGDPARLLAEPDAPWQVHLTSIKPWPSCRHTHPAIACAAAIHGQMKKNGLAIETIEKITVETYQAALDLCDRDDPYTPYAAKFSLHHCVAAALSQPQVGFSAFEAEARQRLAPLRHKTEVRIGAAQQAAYPAHWGTRLGVRFGDGRHLEAEVRDALGDPEAPVAREGLVAKAADLMTHGGWPCPDATIAAILAMAEGGPLPDFVAMIDDRVV